MNINTIMNTLKQKAAEGTLTKEDMYMVAMINNVINNNTNNVKEEKKMTLKERMAAAYGKVEKVDWEAIGTNALNRSGYGIGYGTRTATNEVKYVASKIKDAVCGTKAVQTFTDGYYEGTAQADYDFAMRCADRAEKSREKADAKAAEAAAQELFDEMMG